MDTTETYIKMRIEAIPDTGKGIDCPHHRLTLIVRRGYMGGRIYSVETDDVGNWYVRYSNGEGKILDCQLERQDQLQEMVGDFQTCLRFIANCSIINQGITYKEGGAEYTTHDIRFTSMGQLWLAFAMSQLYQKRWDGTDWTKEGI